MSNPSSNPPHQALAPLKLSTQLAYGAGTVGVSMTGNILVFFVLFFFYGCGGFTTG